MVKHVPAPARASVIFLIGQDSGEPRILARHRDGKLVLPGGKAEPLENPVATVLRETWEETGVFLDANDIGTLTTRHFGYRLVTYHIASYRAAYGAPQSNTVWVSRDQYLANSRFPEDDTAVLRGVKLHSYAYEASPIRSASNTQAAYG